MPGQLSINLSNIIESITILDGCPAPAKIDSQLEKRGNYFSTQEQEKELDEACRALQAAAVKVHELYESIVAQRSEEIAKLSLEIARRILAQKIETKDYEIESIIKEVLKNSPSGQDVVIRLNPGDYEQCLKIQDKETSGMLDGVRLVADPDVGRAECILKSPKGTIASLIDEKLDQINEALGKVS
jgi:flagellar biosynthesis/type III secretory pathway protein FliH